MGPPEDGACTINNVEFDAPPSGLITCTAQERVSTTRFTVTMSCELLRKLICAACRMMLDNPELLSCTCNPEPFWNPLPLMVNVWGEPHAIIGSGVTEVITGAVVAAHTPLLIQTAAVKHATMRPDVLSSGPISASLEIPRSYTRKKALDGITGMGNVLIGGEPPIAR